MTMQRIVFLERESIVAKLRSPDFPHQWIDYPQTAFADIGQRLQGATIAVVNKLPLSEPLLATLPTLRMIAVAATGTNNIDLVACRQRGIVVSNIRGYAAHTVPEHVLALLLALSRNLSAYRQSIAVGVWQRSEHFCSIAWPIRELHGLSMAVVGNGSLGQGVSRLAEAFGMRVLHVERKTARCVRPGYVAFTQALCEADVISLHCPLNAETQQMIGVAELRAMKPDALLINTARGGLVDEVALARALKEGWIGGAACDVLSVEPPGIDHPLLDPALLALPSFLLTPHVAWASQIAMQTLADQLIANLEAFVCGKPQNRVA